MNTKKKIRFENIICLYGMMNEIASKKMTAYKSDLEVDFEDMKAREKTAFHSFGRFVRLAHGSDHFRRTANVILTIKRTIKHLCIVSLI